MTEEQSGAVEVISLADKLSQFDDSRSPRIVGDVNDMQVKVVKLQGQFVWHHHETEDELFLVLKGQLLIKLRDRDLRLAAGDAVVIPHGVEHLPIAEEEAHVLLLEPRTTLNTGTLVNERTVADLGQI